MGLRGSLAGALALLLMAAPVASTMADPVPATAIDRDVAAALRRLGVPGAAVQAIRQGTVIYTKAFGSLDASNGAPVRPDTYFEIGSITKQFTAAAILQLQEAGKLRVDRPLADYLPDAPHAAEVTLRQLLSHTSGLHEYLDGPGIDELATRPIAYPDLIARVATLPLDFPPGSRWSYSNTGYLLLGKVIEAVSGETYRAYLQHHVFDPLGLGEMRTTAEEPYLPNMAVGHHHVDGRLERAGIIGPDWAGPAGFLVMRLRDLAVWDTALRGGKVISPDSYRQMTTPFITSQNGSADYGFGLFVGAVYGQPRIGHTGGSLGFTTADEYFPKQDVRIVALTNLGDDSPEAGEALTNIVFTDLYPALAATAERPAPGEDARVTRAAADAFRDLQTGGDYAHFGVVLGAKLAGGKGAKFATDLAPYGAPTAMTFKGARQSGVERWYDYVLQFGPGVFLPFAVRLGEDGKVAGFSIG
ncbi:serine hydrolase domain-containing protein [Nitrospirillum sp. BR 11164]|uniref:serine hydrolase domain-containing protein n=1 Tax=Nitrospirillum sp. BR 11164 TaxID=3104324 RepID=UPI002AFF7F00|nr:serine hydrolase domain-containing protein [Nitrospirillum sp. BR 11164]MEA1648861.1 serine hydrolase domain-containing protein [Nitrospirillum sp. BR 11164]